MRSSINTPFGNQFGYMYQIYRTALRPGNFLFGNISPIAGNVSLTATLM